jgi:hypothetical protein
MFQFVLWITSAGNVTVTLFMSQKTINITIPADSDIQTFWNLAVKNDDPLCYIISFHEVAHP